MIKIICGPKGAGKTKQIIQLANTNAAAQKGLSVFVTDTYRYVHDVKRPVRFINVTEYNIAGEDALCGFVKGIIAGNYDIEYVYLDGIARIAGKELKDLAATFYMLDKIANQSGLVLTITCSCEQSQLPDFIAKYC